MTYCCIHSLVYKLLFIIAKTLKTLRFRNAIVDIAFHSFNLFRFQFHQRTFFDRICFWWCLVSWNSFTKSGTIRGKTLSQKYFTLKRLNKPSQLCNVYSAGQKFCTLRDAHADLNSNVLLIIIPQYGAKVCFVEWLAMRWIRNPV